MKLGNRIAGIRKDRKVSQNELALRVGVHANLIGRYERDEAVPSVEVASKLADALDVSLDYLVGKTDLNVDKSLLDKLLTIQQFPEEDREHILYSIDGLIQHAKTRIAYKK